MKEVNQKVFALLKSKHTAFAVFISLIQTILSFFTDRFVFEQDARNGLKYLFFKALFFFVIFIAWYFIIDFFKKLFIEKKKEFIIYLALFLFFLLFYSIFLVLIYPGNWMFDDIGMLLAATTNLGLNPLQHILTSVFYILALMVFPIPASVIIIQYAVISAIIAYFIGTLYNRHGYRYLWVGILFILPPVIIHALYPLRLCIFAFLELLFFFILNENKKIAGIKTLTLIIVLNILLAAWRTECIFFILFIPIYLIYKKYRLKTTAVLTILVITIPLIINSMNNYCRDEKDEIGYDVTGIVRPFHALLLEDYEKNNGKLVEKVKDLIDIETAVQYGDGESALWSNVYDGVDTKEKFKRMTDVYFELIKKYPIVLFKERCEVLSVTQNVLDRNGNIRNIVASGNIDFKNSLSSFPNFSNNNISLNPLNMDLRAKVLFFLYSKGENKIIGNMVRWTYNLILPIILLILLLIYSIIKKDRVLMISILFLLAQTGAVFVTAPAPLFMYYLPIYICAYGLSVSKIQGVIKNEYNKKNN